MTNIVVIALEFAPVQTTGAFRSIALVKYLHKFGYRPIVITIHPDDGSEIFGAKINPALFDGLPDDLQIFHVRPTHVIGNEGRLQQFFRIFTTLDDGFFQRLENALEDALQDIKKQFSVGAVYATLPPFGAGRLGMLAAKRLQVPLILDLRDAWSEWSSSPFPTYRHYQRRLSDERQAFQQAAAVVTVTEQLRDVFIETHPQIPADKFHVAPNGFDGPEFESVTVSSSSSRNGSFDIGYVGSFYYTPKSSHGWQSKLHRPHKLLQYQRGKEDWSYRSPLYFFRAWQELFGTEPQLAKQIRFHHLGVTPDWLASMAKDHGIAQYCTFWGMLPKQVLMEHLKNIDAFLATSMKRPKGGDYCLASKTFDYLLAKKPILGFVTKGSQRDFLLKSGAAVICDPDDVKASAKALEEVVKGEIDLKLNSEYVNKFNRLEMTRKIATVFEKVIVSTPEKNSN